MSRIGIIANPASGKDIRRLVAHASGMDNREKVSIVRRVLLGIASIGVDEVALMPDSFGIGARARDGLTLPFRVSHLDMRIDAGAEDSRAAARRFRQRGVGCIVVLGGDGTHRMVAKGCGAVPLVPISTGTNNVWPDQNEGTLAGLAAALVARRFIAPEQAARPTKRLEIFHRADGVEARPSGSPADFALVDVAAYDSPVIGSKAVWEVERLKEIVLSTFDPGNMGLSSIGGALPKPTDADHAGLHIRVGAGPQVVLAAIAPGMVRRVPILDHRWLKPGETVTISSKPCTLALDGEREIAVSETDQLTVCPTWDGPRMVDVRETLRLAAERGHFVRTADC